MSHGRDTSPKPYGVVADFATPEELIAAAKAARAEGYSSMEGYSPMPVHGLTDAIGAKDDVRLSWAVGAAGAFGAAAGIGMQLWVSQTAYAHNVGGKPFASFPMFVPVTFECMILFAALTAAGAMIAFNGLPKPHHPVLNAEAMGRATSDRFVLCIEAADPSYSEDKVVAFFKSQNALSVEAIMTSEGY
jgi:hypothetical protein